MSKEFYLSWRPGTRKEEDRADIRDTGGHALSLSVDTKYILPHHSFVRRNIEYGHLNTVRKLLGLRNQKHMQSMVHQCTVVFGGDRI